MKIERRKFLIGMTSLVFSPAIVRIENIMPIYSINHYPILTIDMITRGAIELFVNTNAFIKNLDRQYDEEFGKAGSVIGSQLRIRLPNNYLSNAI